MARQFEIVFKRDKKIVIADLLEDKAPITCEAFWEAIKNPLHEILHHGKETGPEMWCFVPAPKEELPYENSTVFPEHGEILFYHYLQPPKTDGTMIYDIGIYWDRGQSKLKQGWIPGNLFARVCNKEHIELLRCEAGYLLTLGTSPIILRRKN